MNKIFRAFVVALAFCLLACTFTITAFAAATGTATIACDTSLKKGENVTVTVSIKAHSSDPKIWSADGDLSYNKNVLKFVDCSATANEKSSGKITFSYNGSGNNSVASITFKFTAIANGKSTVSLSNAYYYGDIDNSSYSVGGQAVNITVADPVVSSKPQSSSKPQTSSKPTSTVKSNNANLSSLDIGGAALSPLFSGNTLTYSVTVENSVAAVNINAKTAHSKATVSGAGQKSLEVGDNEFKIVVTAQDGTKKTYTLKIRRATVEESIQLNPLLVIINGEMHHINADLTGAEIPVGFTLGKATYNGKEIDVFKSEQGDYTLYSITKDQPGSTDYYVYKEHRDEFALLNYMTVNNELYIFAELPENYTVPNGYYETATTLGNGTVKAFCSQNEALKDFYVIYCYADGEEGFFRFDTLKTTIQRAPEFTLTPSGGTSEGGKSFNPIELFKSFSMTEKIMSCSLLGAVVIILILIIALAVKSRKLKKARYSDPISDEDMEDFFNIASVTPKHEMITEEEPAEEETAEE